MSIPSIAMIPSGYKANKVYSVLPTDGSGDLNFARTTTATRVNQNGLIEEVAIGVSRLDYIYGSCPSLLLEPTSTNSVTNSNDFSAYNISGGATITSNYIISPDGALNATRLQSDALSLSGISKITDIGTSIENKIHTVSCWIKSNGANTDFRLKCTHSGVLDYFSSNLTATSEWQRFTFTQLFGAGASTTINSGVINSTLNNSTDLSIYGFQVETESSYATSYIPTAGTAITRTADSASKSGISSLINSSEGVLYAEISALSNDGTNRYISLNNGSTTNLVSISLFNDSTIRARIVIDGVSTYLSSGVITQTETLKIALKYRLNDYALFLNGLEVDSNSLLGAFTPNTLTRLDFARFTINPFYGKCKDLRVYKTALTDSELTTLTTL